MLKHHEEELVNTVWMYSKCLTIAELSMCVIKQLPVYQINRNNNNSNLKRWLCLASNEVMIHRRPSETHTHTTHYILHYTWHTAAAFSCFCSSCVHFFFLSFCSWGNPLATAAMATWLIGVIPLIELESINISRTNRNSTHAHTHTHTHSLCHRRDLWPLDDL